MSHSVAILALYYHFSTLFFISQLQDENCMVRQEYDCMVIDYQLVRAEFVNILKQYVRIKGEQISIHPSSVYRILMLLS